MSFRGFQPTNGDEERKEWSPLSQTLASNVHKISQNVNQIQRLINQLETSEDSDALRTQLHEVQETSAQLTRNTNNYLKELTQLVQSMASVDQNRRNPLINSSNAYNNRKTNFVIDNNNSKQFSVEKFMTPSSIVSKKSNFYEGKTVFGGANASRAARLAGTTPYNLLQRHHLAPVLRVNVETSKRFVESSEPLSSSSQRILEKLEKASTPLQDARRIPTSVQHKNYFQTSDLLHRTTKRPKLGANPVFSQTTIEQPFEPKRWELKLSNKDDRKVSATETTDVLINSCDNKYLSDSIDNKSNESFGGKIMRRDSKREEKRPKPLTANGGQNDNLDLLLITQPLTMPSSLPKFNFGSNSSAGKPTPTTVLTKIIETQELSKDLIFKFSEPSLKIKDQKSDPVLNEVLRTGKNGKKSFVFSSPLSAITHKSSNDSQKVEKESNVLKQSTPTPPETNLIESKTESKKSETSTEKWICVCLFQNISSDTKCKACKKDRISQLTPPLTSKANTRVESNVIKNSSTPITQNTTIGWGNHFKPPSGSWSCSVCMVSNPSDKSKCVACEEPKPGATPSISSNDSQWGNKFKPPTGSWSCSVCMVSNPSDKTRCLACEEPKPGSVTSSTKDSPKGQSGLWQCFYCQQNNEMSKTVCTSCAKIKTAVATKEDLSKLYGGQTFKFGVTQEMKDTKNDNKEKIHSNEGKTDIFNKTTNNSIFSKSNESLSQTSTSNSFVFGSTVSEEKKLSNSFVPKTSNTSDGAKSLFKFGAPPESSKPISEVNPTEKTNTNISDIFGVSKAANPSFSFGSQSTTSTSINPKPTVDSQLFVFGTQNKESDPMKSKKNVSFELEDNNKSSSEAFVNKSSTDSTPLSFQIPKPSEDNQQIFKNFNSSSSGSLFGLTSSTTKDATPVATVTSTVSITSFMDNKFTSKTNESQNKSIGSLFGGPASTTASASFSSPFSLTNSFSGQKSTPTTGQNAVSVANDTKSLFSLTPSSSIKSFDSIISSQTNPMTTNSSATPTAPLGLSNSSSSQKGLVFGNSNPSLQSFSSQSSTATTKPNFSFNLSANTANSTATTTDSAFGSNASTLFGSNPSKGFNFGTSSLNSSQPAFSFTIPSTNSLSNTSSNINFGLNSNAINTTSAETNSKTANSLFAFGGQNSDQSFTSPLTQKPSNNTNTNPKTSSQFSFGLTSNPSTGQPNSNNLFANAINPTQNSLSFNQMSGTAAAANPQPFTFGGFGTTPSAPASMPQLQNQSQQQPPIPPPAFNFSAQPSFDFTSIPNAGTQPTTGPVFQFSADQTSQAVVASNRNIKKAKRRLNPT